MAKKPLKKKKVIKLPAKKASKKAVAPTKATQKPTKKASSRKYETTAPKKAVKKQPANNIQKSIGSGKKLFMPQVRARMNEMGSRSENSQKKATKTKSTAKPTLKAPKKAISPSRGKAKVQTPVKNAPKSSKQANRGKKSAKSGSTKAKKKLPPKPKITEKNKSEKYHDKEFAALYQKVWRKKSKVQELNEHIKSKKRGFKAKRTLEYKQLVELNKELTALCKKKGYSLPEDVTLRKKNVKKKRSAPEKADIVRGIIRYTAKVWEFESTLAIFINNKVFKRIFIKNTGEMFYTNKHKPSTILYGYDQARNSAYNDPFATTPFVDVEENEADSILSLEIIS